MRASYGKGRLHAGEEDVVFLPRTQQANRRLVVACHSLGDRAGVWVNAVNKQAQLLAGLAFAGLTVVASDMGGDTWGGATASARIEEIRGKAATYGCATDKVVLLGSSMGGAACWGYRRDHPARVAGIATLLGAVNLTRLWNDDVAGSRATMAPAYGVTFPASLPSWADHSLNAATLAGVPSWHGYSTGDLTILPADSLAFANAVGGTAVAVGSGPHSDAMAGAAPVADLVAFCRAAGA